MCGAWVQMRVVREAREDMGMLAQRFAGRGTSFVCARINQVREAGHSELAGGSQHPLRHFTSTEWAGQSKSSIF